MYTVLLIVLLLDSLVMATAILLQAGRAGAWHRWAADPERRW